MMLNAAQPMLPNLVKRSPRQLAPPVVRRSRFRIALDFDKLVKDAGVDPSEAIKLADKVLREEGNNAHCPDLRSREEQTVAGRRRRAEERQNGGTLEHHLHQAGSRHLDERSRVRAAANGYERPAAEGSTDRHKGNRQGSRSDVHQFAQAGGANAIHGRTGQSAGGGQGRGGPG